MYTLTLSESDVRDIRFVGGRYGWSEALRCYEPGEHKIPESEAWGIREAFESDTEGNHSYFPMLGGGELRDKLYAFMDSIV